MDSRKKADLEALGRAIDADLREARLAAESAARRNSLRERAALLVLGELIRQSPTPITAEVRTQLVNDVAAIAGQIAAAIEGARE